MRYAWKIFYIFGWLKGGPLCIVGVFKLMDCQTT